MRQVFSTPPISGAHSPGLRTSGEEYLNVHAALDGYYYRDCLRLTYRTANDLTKPAASVLHLLLSRVMKV
jgi:hypothetical protein